MPEVIRNIIRSPGAGSHQTLDLAPDPHFNHTWISPLVEVAISSPTKAREE